MKGWLYQQYANDTCKVAIENTQRVDETPVRVSPPYPNRTYPIPNNNENLTRHKGLVLNRVKQINNKLQRFHNNKLGVPPKVENRLEQIENIRRGCMKHPARRGYHPTPSPP